MATTPALSFADPPVDGLHRGIVSKPLTARAIAGRADWLAERSATLVRALSGKTQPDLVWDLAMPLSLGAVIELFRGAPDQGELFQALNVAQREFFNTYLPTTELAQETEAIEQRFYDHVMEYQDQKREKPDDSLLSALLAGADGQTISEDEMFVLCHIFLAAAFESTAAGLTNTLYGLLTHHDQLDIVLAEPSQMQAAFEEGVRMESPIQRTARIAGADTVLNGCEIFKGDTIFLFWLLQTGIPTCSQIRIGSLSTVPAAVRSPSATAHTFASAPVWRAWKLRLHCRRSWPSSPKFGLPKDSIRFGLATH